MVKYRAGRKSPAEKLIKERRGKNEASETSKKTFNGVLSLS